MKFNNISYNNYNISIDWQEEIKLPPRITIELRPRNNMAWWQVQASSMNPRVRTLLPIQRRLSSLLIFLQQRWRPAKYNTVSLLQNRLPILMYLVLYLIRKRVLRKFLYI